MPDSTKKIKAIQPSKRIVSAVFAMGAMIVLVMLAMIIPFALPYETQAGTTWTVTTLVDDADDGTCAAHCSIRDAIAASAAGDFITFGVGGTLTIGSGTGVGEFVLPSGIVIDGTGVSIDGDGATRIFLLTDDTTVRNFAALFDTAGEIIKMGDTSPERNVIQNNGISAGFSIGIQLRCDSGTASDNIIRDNTIVGGSIAIEVTSVGAAEIVETEIFGNAASGAGDSTIALGGDNTNRNWVHNNTTTGATGVVVNDGNDNRVGPGNSLTSAAAFSVSIREAQRTVIDNNDAANGGGLSGSSTGIRIDNSLGARESSTIIVDNDINNSSIAGIDLVDLSNVSITNTVISGSPTAVLVNDVDGVTVSNATFAATGIDIDPNAANPFEIQAYNTTFGGPTPIPSTDFALSTQEFRSYKHNGLSGATQMWGGGLVTGSGETLRADYASESYSGTQNIVNARPGSVSQVAINSVATQSTAETVILRYNAVAGNWDVTGTTSGAGAPAVSGVQYNMGTGFSFTLTEAAPVDGDYISIDLTATAADSNTQKIITMNPVAPALNGGRSQMTISAGGQLNLTGITGTASTILAPGSAHFDLIVDGGTLNANEFALTRLGPSGLRVTSTSVIASLQNGSFSATQAGGTHLAIDGIDNATTPAPYTGLIFDASPTYDVTATGAAQVLICESTRGTGIDNVQAGSSVAYCAAPVITNFSVSQRTDGSRIADIGLTVADADNDTVTIASLEYSTNGGVTWSPMTSNLTGTTLQASPAGTTVTGGTWNVQANLPIFETDTLFARVVVSDARATSQPSVISNVSVDTKDPTGLAPLQATSATESTMQWQWGVVSESHFRDYVLSYGTTNGGPYPNRWSTANDFRLASRTTSTTTVSGLTPQTLYVAQITARDTFGNTTTYREGSGATSNGATAIRVHAFQDIDTSGAQGAAEGNIAGKSVSLYRDNGDGVLGPQDGKVDERGTDQLGVVLFDQLQAGTYIVNLNIEQQERVTTANVPLLVRLASGTTELVEVGIVSPSTQHILTLVADKTTIKGDGTDRAVITATITDGRGNPLTGRSTVNFTTTLGNLSESSVDTQTGSATTELSSNDLGVAIVSAEVNGIAKSIDIRATQSGVAGIQDISEDEESPVPEGLNTVRNIAAISSAALAALALLTLLSAFALAQLPLALLNLINNLLTLFGLKPKRVKWGVVYDSITKEPIKLAVVRLLDPLTSKVLDTNITDNDGRFGFILKSGSYTFQVSKAGYRFPSAVVTAQVDGKYTNVYTGGPLEVTEEEAQKMNVNIPLDALIASEAPRFYRLKKVMYRAIDVMQRINIWVIIFGLIASVALLILDPGALAITFVVVQFIFLIIKILVIGAYKKAWGVTFSTESGEPIPGTVVEIYNKATNVKKGVVLSDILGRFKFLPSQGEFFLRPIKTDYEHTDPSGRVKYKNVYKKGETIVIDDPKEAIVDKNIAMKTKS